MIAYIAVAVGAAVGAMFRYGLVNWMPVAKSGFPYATLLVNIVGSLLVGALYVLIVERSGLDSYWREVLMVGFCGGLTTFSAFSLEAVFLWQAGHVQTALIYVVLSLIFCIVAAFVGIALMRVL